MPRAGAVQLLQIGRVEFMQLRHGLRRPVVARSELLVRIDPAAIRSAHDDTHVAVGPRTWRVRIEGLAGRLQLYVVRCCAVTLIDICSRALLRGQQHLCTSAFLHGYVDRALNALRHRRHVVLLVTHPCDVHVAHRDRLPLVFRNELAPQVAQHLALLKAS